MTALAVGTDPRANVLAGWHACAEWEKARGRSEYGRYCAVARSFAKQYRASREVAAAVLAVLSPSLNWQQNQAAAHCVFQGLPAGGYGHNVKKARAIVMHKHGRERHVTRLFGGPKVTAFYRLIRDGGNQTDVCVDGHAFNLAWGLGRTTLKQVSGSKLEFDIARQAFRDAALEVGERPCDLQAATWLAWRSSHGFIQGRLGFDYAG